MHVAANVELAADEDLGRREIALGILRVVFGFALLVGTVALLGWRYRAPLEHFGHWFVDRFGIGGMAAGAFLADGCHFPLPPQFYLLTGIAAGVSPFVALAAVLAGSIAGGAFVFAAARRAGRVVFFETHVATTRILFERLVHRWGAWGLVVVGMLPVSYFVLCALAGMMRLRPHAFAVLDAHAHPEARALVGAHRCRMGMIIVTSA